MTKPKTTPAGPLWPSVTPTKPKGKKTAAGTVKPAQIQSGGELEICSEPPPRTTLGPRTSKYIESFEALTVGQGLRCSKEKTGPVAVAMRSWIKRTGRKDVGVISISDYGDGKGRVWLVSTKKDAS